MAAMEAFQLLTVRCCDSILGVFPQPVVYPIVQCTNCSRTPVAVHAEVIQVSTTEAATGCMGCQSLVATDGPHAYLMIM